MLRENDHRPFEVGTTGWTADALDDPRIERLWERGRYEIVEGVLAKMAPAYFDYVAPLDRLMDIVKAYFKRAGIKGQFAPETDLIVGSLRVGRPDTLFLTTEQMKQQAAQNRSKRKGVKYGRLVVAPLLVIESVSPGHESHDRQTKRRWYEERGVANYWILDAMRKSLECLRLVKKKYAVDAEGTQKQRLKPSAFPGLIVPLGKLWV